MAQLKDMHVYVESFIIKVDAVTGEPVTPEKMGDFMLGLGEVAEKLGWRVIQVTGGEVFDDEVPEDG